MGWVRLYLPLNTEIQEKNYASHPIHSHLRYAALLLGQDGKALLRLITTAYRLRLQRDWVGRTPRVYPRLRHS